MASMNITINGQEVVAETGQTVLEAAAAAAIEIPTLCHHPALKPIGACRVCLVEVAGQRGLQPACTFPVAPRMAIQTESPKVVEARKFVLELIFSERNHFCMTCEMSGDCELQKLGYRYGLDHWMYPTYTQSFPVDATPDGFLLDHNRCVLCRRCLRACSELAANHTLDLRQRGALTMVTADMNVSLAQSTCISCGICLDVCPTGALVDKRSAFAGRQSDTVRIDSICSQCSIGCGIGMVVRSDAVLRIRGRWDAPANGGRMCKKGRFESMADNRMRTLTPAKRLGGRRMPAAWNDALQLAAEHISAAAAPRLGVLTTTAATNEALYLLKEVFCGLLKTGQVALFNDTAPAAPLQARAVLGDLSKSDCIVVTGTDPVKNLPVAGMLIKQAVDRGARLISIADSPGELALYADATLTVNETDQAVAMARQARYPVIVYGHDLSGKVFTALRKVDQALFLALQPGVNTQAAMSLDLSHKIDFNGLQVFFVLAGEQSERLEEVAAKIPAETFVVVQACYVSALTERADVVLPMATWPERSGSLTNTEGVVQKVNAARTPRGEAKPDWEILRLLAEKLGNPSKFSIDGMVSFMAPAFQGKENPTWPK
jgi:formate dehydrogenase major subunit